LIRTDAPIDNHGLGQGFSPTDLVATALGACMITVMGIKAADKGWPLVEVSCEVLKVMKESPRRIGSIELLITMPAKLEVQQREILERVALTCPVARSLSNELEQVVQFSYDG
jgi:uncharacterized OsmC-like protein